MKRFMIFLALMLSAALLLTGCAALDVVLAHSRTSLDDLLAAYPALLGEDASGRYERVSVDGETALLVSRDFAASGAYDILIETPLKPFLDAGLDETKLSNGFRADGGLLYLSADFGGSAGKNAGVSGAIVDAAGFAPMALSFHASLGHFGLSLGGGKFEWAQDYQTNDKDIVFVLDVAALTALGVDAANVSGWTLMTMQDDAGKDFDVLLKPYSLGNG